MTPQSASLICTENSSDKAYACDLLQRDTGWVVEVRYGRRGGPQTCGTKTPTPLPYEKALAIFTKLVREKRAKGYHDADGSGSNYQDAERAARDSGLRPQLLTPIDAVQAQVLISDPSVASQEKYDGERRLVVVENDTVTGVNRNGLVVPLALPIVEAIKTLFAGNKGRAVLDGEDLGERYAPFDLLAFEGNSLTEERYERRLHMLYAVLGALGVNPCIIRPVTAGTATEKRAMLDQLRLENAEGVVFKNKDAPYRPGVSADAAKFKFTASVTAEVIAGRDGKRSVGLQVIGENGEKVFIGNCTIPANASIPPEGGLCEVQYLYAYPAGSLAQPVFKCQRYDQMQADRYSSLKFKRSDEAEAA